jgi:hypothetical protein
MTFVTKPTLDTCGLSFTSTRAAFFCNPVWEYFLDKDAKYDCSFPGLQYCQHRFLLDTIESFVFFLEVQLNSST